jgi:hypothetical protein
LYYIQLYFTLILKFYENFEIFETLKILSFWIFWKSYDIFESFEILWKLWIFKKNIWNFKKFLKFSNLKKKWIWIFFFNFPIFKVFENFQILWNFLTLISKKQFLCNKKPYCTLVPRNFIHWFCTNNMLDYYIRLYFTVFLLARSNTRDIPFSNILISKKQFLCNK